MFQAAGPARSRHARISVCHRPAGFRAVPRPGVGPREEHGRACAWWARATSTGSSRWARPALQAVEQYLGNGRPQLLKGRASPYLFVTNRGGAMIAASFLEAAGRLRQEGWNFPRPDAARPAAYFRDAFTGRRGGPAKPANHAGPRRYIDYPDLYPCNAFAVAEDRGRASSESLNGFDQRCKSA